MEPFRFEREEWIEIFDDPFLVEEIFPSFGLTLAAAEPALDYNGRRVIKRWLLNIRIN